LILANIVSNFKVVLKKLSWRKHMDLCSLSKLLDDLKNTEEYLKKECGLTYKEAGMLCSIDKGFNEPAKLAKRLELSPSRTSRIISSLEMKNLTLREASKTDKRIICLKLSKKGNNLLLRIRETKLPIPLYLKDVLEQLDIKN
jgi:DNA-binding MarR family transcriptional regulator